MFTKRVFLASLALVLGAVPAFAQDAANFPNKPIRVIVPFPPGQSADIIVRLLADTIKRQSGHSIVVENKPGGNTIIGSSEAARARPDGYTILMAGTTAMSAAASMNASLPYDPVKMTPITGVALNSYLLVVKPDHPAKSATDIIRMAKEQPGKLSYGSGNQSGRMAAELFKDMAGVNLLHVPYQGTEQAISDLINGQITMMFNGTLTSNAYIKRKELKALGVSSEEREPEYPDVPTINTELKGYSFVAWQGLVGPPGIPAPVANALNKMFADALRDKETNEKLTKLGLTVWPTTVAALGTFMAQDKDKWKSLVVKAGIPIAP